MRNLSKNFSVLTKGGSCNTSHPLVYNKAITLAVDVVRAQNGWNDQLFNKCSVYSAIRMAKKYKEERDKANYEKNRCCRGRGTTYRRR